MRLQHYYIITARYTEDTAKTICEHIADGLSLQRIKKLKGMPTISGIMKWLSKGEAFKADGKSDQPKALFVEQYARAKEIGPPRCSRSDELPNNVRWTLTDGRHVEPGPAYDALTDEEMEGAKARTPLQRAYRQGEAPGRFPESGASRSSCRRRTATSSKQSCRAPTAAPSRRSAPPDSVPDDLVAAVAEVLTRKAG